MEPPDDDSSASVFLSRIIPLFPDELPILEINRDLPDEPNASEEKLAAEDVENEPNEHNIHATGDDVHFDRREADHYKVYKERWYILLVFAIVGIWQNLVFATFGPIAQSAQIALDLTQTDLALLPNWYNIVYVFSAFPFVWLVEVKGLRMPMTATMAFCCIGAAVRCLHTGDKNFDKTFLHLGQIINGFGAAVPWFACTTISAVWFPPGQRNLATAIGLFASNFGVAIAFIVGPGFIQIYQGSGTPEEIYQAIYKLFYFEAIISNALLFLTVFYFPSKPPTPPSFTAKAARVSYRQGFLDFAKNYQGWLICLIYSLSTIFGSWNQFLALTLQGVMSELECGWLGFTLTTAQILFGPVLATILSVPYLTARSRGITTILVLLGCGFIALFVVASMVPSQRYLLSKGLIWGTLVPAIVLTTTPQPIWWEMACDTLYPISESIISGIFSVGSCSVSAVFLIIFMFPQLGSLWINWVLLAFQSLIVPLLLLYRHHGKRSIAELSASADIVINDG